MFEDCYLCLEGMMVKMKMKFGVFLLPLIFFNFFQQINGEIIEIKDIGCQNWTELLHDQNMTQVTEDYIYRFLKHRNEEISIFLGNEPLTIWLDLKNETMFEIYLKASGYPQRNNPKAFFQVYGRSDCEMKINATKTKLNYSFHLTVPDCFTSCPQYQEKYTPVTMWSEGGPVEISSLLSYQENRTQLNLYLPENQMNDFIDKKPCVQSRFLKEGFLTPDYAHLISDPNEVFKNESGINFIRLKSHGNTVVWVEIKDSAPEHYIIIQLENGSQPLDENVVVGLEANGVEPVSFDLEKKFTKIPNGIKIYLKKVICRFNYNFIGHIRYIFTVGSKVNLTATFYDASGVNLELKYFDEEYDGIPKLYEEPYNFEYYIISLEPPTTTKTTKTSTRTKFPTSNMNPNDEIDESHSAVPIISHENAAEICGFFLPVIIAILIVQKFCNFFVF